MFHPPDRLLLRLAAAVGAVMVAAFASFGWVQSRNQTSLYLRAALERSDATTALLADRSAHYIILQDYASLDEFLLSSSILPNIREILALEEDGWAVSLVVRENGEKPRLLPPPGKGSFAAFNGAPPPLFEGENTLVVWKPVGAAIRVGWLRVTYDTGYIADMKNEIWRHTAFMTLLWLLASMAVVFVILRGQVKNIERLTVFARGLQENKGSRISLPDSTIEINHLADSLNAASGELYEAEKSMRASLLEKEAMLKEIHHRVKNNMAVISSLLNMQSARVRDPEVAEMFKESRGRIMAMALVHEKLYSARDLARIDVADYLTSLAEGIKTMFGRGTGVKMTFDIEDVNLDMDILIPCGLIMNELITNSFKHAFKQGGGHEVAITLKADGDKGVRFGIADNGVGLPEGFDADKSTGLGLRLVSALCAQIHGALDYKSENGASFMLTFPKTIQMARA